MAINIKNVNWILRLLQTRFFDSWSRQLSFEEKRALLLRFWAGLNKGLDYRERYLLLRETYEDQHMKNYSLLDSAAQARIYGYFSLVNEIRNVEGDIVETGVGRGVSLAALAYAVSYFKLKKEVFGFDSFAGFPAASQEDLGSRVQNLERVVAGEVLHRK